MFALGSTLAWAAAARGPFAADQAAATLYRIISRPPDLRGVPPRVVEIVEACLVKDAARRPTAVQLAVWLRGNGACGNVPDGNVPGATTVAHPLGPPPAPLPQPPPPRRRGLGLGAGALAAVVAAGVVTAAAAQPLTVDAYSAGVNRYLDGTRSSRWPRPS